MLPIDSILIFMNSGMVFPQFVAQLDDDGTFQALTLKSFKSKKKGNEGLPKKIHAGEILTVSAVFRKEGSKNYPYRWKVRNEDGKEGIISPKWMVVLRSSSFHGIPQHQHSRKHRVLFRLCNQREVKDPFPLDLNEIVDVVGFEGEKDGISSWRIESSNGEQVCYRPLLQKSINTNSYLGSDSIPINGFHHVQ